MLGVANIPANQHICALIHVHHTFSLTGSGPPKDSRSLSGGFSYKKNRRNKCLTCGDLQRFGDPYNCFYAAASSTVGKGSVNGHRCLLHARTSLMCKPSQTACQSVEINESEKVVKYWLQYVYSGRVEWEKDDTVRIQKIAEQYGPDDLLPLCTRMLTSPHLELKTAVSAISATGSSSIPDFYGTNRGMATGTTERVNQPTSVPQSDVGQHSLSTVVIPNELALKLTSSSAVDKVDSDITMDYEDPLQGLSLVDTSEDRETNNQSVIIGLQEESITRGFYDIQVDLPKPHMKVTSQSATQSYMEITLFDIAMTDHSEAPTDGNSPDIFEDKSKDSCAAGFLSYPFGFRSYLLTALFSSSALHNVAVLRNGEHEQELNKVSEASFKPLITNHSESSKIDACDAEVVCLDEVAEQDRKSTFKDPYESEYFNYYDSFVEQWYEPVDDSASNQVNYELKMPHESFREGNQQCITEATTDSASIGVSSQDSFFDTSKFIASAKPDLVNPSSFAENNHSVDLAPPAAHSTPHQPTRKKPRFGSNVKILKTTDITPMPDYDSMNDECLKNELRKFGLKPMGRKRSIAILKKIYAEIHPEIDPSTPTIRPLVVDDIEDHEQQAPKCKSTKSRTRGQAIRTLPEAMRIADLPPAVSKDAQIESMEENEDEDFIDLGDKTLNDPTDEPPEESIIDDGLLPKDLESMTRTFLNWLQSPENEELYNHLLSLQPVLLVCF
ncbi:unnamed protein product [Angiostrongylus costaricensis]|uniref:BTB domain-containing protein n=1 Tax=Angiostrongylus costaricensis TaxID=334426 RepID=A0A158PMC4_ANGCS|nr:unnamed protein product [Angiostrongylus costaricensis]